MPDINDITRFLADNIVIIALVVAVIFLFLKFYKSSGKSKYKKIELTKEIRSMFKELFSISQEQHGYGKTLFIGSRHSGFVMKSIIFPYEQSIKLGLKKSIEYKKKLEALRKEKNNHRKDNYDLDDFYDEKIAELKEDYKDSKKDITHKLVAFKVCGKSRLSRVIANILGIGINYFVVNDNLLSEDATSFYIAHECRPSNYLGIWLFDNSGREYLKHLTFKLNQEQELDALVNHIPKQSFFEVEQAKTKASIELLGEIDKAKKKSMIEDVKSGKQ